MRLAHLFRPWIYLFSILIAAVMFGAVLFILMSSRNSMPQTRAATVVVTILPAPTSTSTPSATPLVSPTPTLSGLPTPLPGDIGVGSFVQIVGTGGDGLRLRDKPGLGTTVLTMVSDTEVFKVMEGPNQVDGYNWWYLADPYNEKRRGWAVANYLMLEKNP